MSILYDEAQEAIAKESRRVLDAQFDKDKLLGLLDGTGRFDEAFWKTAVEQGWTGLAVPEEYGGLGLGLLEMGLIAQSAGALCAGAPFLTGNYGVTQILASCTNGALKQAWLPRLASGDAIGVVAFEEAGAPLPSDPAVKYEGGRLSGKKAAVPGALKADFAIVWAMSGGKPVLVLAELNAAMSRAVDSFDNSRLYAEISFDGAEAAVLFEGEAARCGALDCLARMAVVAAHEQMGGAETALLLARDYALERKAFGQPIGAFQSIKHSIAELYGLVEVARANSIHAASLEGQGGFLAAACAARLSGCEAYDTAARDAVQIHGGIGVTWQLGLHLHMRRARSLSIELGNALFWEDLLVTELEAKAA
ncbi:MAG: acyl-CoA/acyl-ACP dehydrogenase [Sphingomonadaceae bacterium]|nr:acyl-CoA/acyl-ACP dehydrogenase [Sphingomonadaceae bacterium]